MASVDNNKPTERVAVNEQDFLDQDPQIRGQNYVCVSFVSPEDVIKSKEAYFVSAYLESLCKRSNELMDGLESMFPDKKNEFRSIKEQYDVFFDTTKVDDDFKSFKCEHEMDISAKFSEENNYQTSIRGIKIRGTYETQREAEVRAEVLKRMDDNKHNIYIAQVGCWCPWSANPDDIQNGEYSETELNTLMKEYKKNCENKEIFYNERKKDLLERTREETEQKKNAQASTSSSSEEDEKTLLGADSVVPENVDEQEAIKEDEDVVDTKTVEESLFDGNDDHVLQKALEETTTL